MRVGEFVKVSPSRGASIAYKIARIVSIRGKGLSEEAEIIFEDGKKKIFYTAHLYRDPETTKRSRQFRVESAQKIGKNDAQLPLSI